MLVSLKFAQPRASCSCSSTCLTKAGRVSQGCPGRTDGNLALLRGQKIDVERRPCPTHTYTYSSSFRGRLSQQISFFKPHHTVFLSFSFFLEIQTGFEAKAAFDPSRFVNIPTNLSASTSNFTNFKKIYTDIPLELPKDDQELILQGFNDVL